MKIGVIGLGYVGLPLAVCFAEAGVEVVGIDLNAERVEQLKAGSSYIDDIPQQRYAACAELIKPSTDYQDLASCDAVLICVPTPLTRNREPDLTPLLSTAHALAKTLNKGQLVVLESTTYPGTTREQLLPILESSGLKIGEDFNLAFSPERVDPGRSDYTIATTPKLVGGITPACVERASKLYELICEQVVALSSPETAELAKLLENIFRSVNIALVNELAMVADRMNIDIWEVVDAAATKPFGFMRFDPGPGMGGHCLPVDPFYLAWKAREYDLSTEFIELAGKVNQRMPYFCVERIEQALNDLNRPVKDTKILILGVSYKAGVGDLRESPALKIMDILQARGANLSYHDPFVPTLERFGLTNSPLDGALDENDLTVIVTAHPGVNYGEIVERSPLVVDLRGVTAKNTSEKIVRL